MSLKNQGSTLKNRSEFSNDNGKNVSLDQIMSRETVKQSMLK